MDLSAAKKTIRDLLNLADDDAAARLEVDNALHFARRLMLRHNLTADDCPEEKPKNAHEVAADEEYGTSETYSVGARLSTWESDLYSAIKNLVGTVHFYQSGRRLKRTAYGTVAYGANGKMARGTRITYYGPAADCAAATDLATTWAATIAALARMKFGGCFRGAGRSYAEGFATALWVKVQDLEQEEYKKIQAPTSTALALCRAHEIMSAKLDKGEEWLREEKGIKLHKCAGRSRAGGNDGAYAAGQADGAAANFSRTTRKAIG